MTLAKIRRLVLNIVTVPFDAEAAGPVVEPKPAARQPVAPVTDEDGPCHGWEMAAPSFLVVSMRPRPPR